MWLSALRTSRLALPCLPLEMFLFLKTTLSKIIFLLWRRAALCLNFVFWRTAKSRKRLLYVSAVYTYTTEQIIPVWHRCSLVYIPSRVWKRKGARGDCRSLVEMETFVLPVIPELYILTLISSQSFPGLISSLMPFKKRLNNIVPHGDSDRITRNARLFEHGQSIQERN